MKKVIIMITVFMLLLTSVMPIVSAAETDIFSEGYIEINAKDFVSSSGGIQIDANRWVCFRDNKWAEYKVNVPAGGEYYLFMHSSTNTGQDSNLSISVNGEEQFVRKVAQTAGLRTSRINYVGKITLSDGENILKIASVGLLSYADKFYISQTPMYAAEGIENAYKAVNFVGAASTQRNEKGYAVLHGSSSSGWYEYEIFAEKAGKADLSILTAGTTAIKVSATVNKTPLETVTIASTTSYSIFEKNKLARIDLNEGINTLKIEITSGGCYLDDFYIEYLKPIKTESIEALGEYDAMSGEIPRETDYLTVSFSKNVLAESVSEETVKLLNGNTSVKAEVKAEDEKVIVSLKETLDYGASYKLAINGVKDAEDFSKIENEEYDITVMTEPAMIKNAKLAVTDSEITYENVKIKGAVYSSRDLAISGRKVTVSVLSPTSQIVDTGVEGVFSDENGNFEIECSLPEGSAYGVYTFNVECEYGKEDFNVQLFYVSQSLEQEILSDFNDIDSAQLAEALLEEYEEELDINMEEDLAEINPDDFYKNFIGKTHDTVYGLRDYYLAVITMCKMLVAEVPMQMKSQLSEENCKYLGIEYGKISLINTNETALYMAIMSIDKEIAFDDFVRELNICIEKCLADEYGKTAAELSLSDEDIYVNQSVEVPIVLSKALSDIDKITLKITFDDAEFFNVVNITTKEDGWKINKLEDGVKIELEKINLKDGVNLGKIFMSGFSETGTYKFDISGTVYYEIGIDYPIVADVKNASAQITVKEEKKQNSGGGTVSSVQSSGTGGGRPAITTPVITPPADDKAETEFKFTDIANVSWAEGDIYGLVKLGAIAQSEDKCFYPDRNITRSEFIKMLVVAMGIEDKNAQADFEDVTKDKWYYNVVASAQNAGLILGDENGCFNPDEYITRENIAVIMARVYESKGYTFESAQKNKFNDDEKISDYAKDAVYNMQSIGVINGMDGNNFAPKVPATRAQVAKMIYRTVSEVRAW